MYVSAESSLKNWIFTDQWFELVLDQYFNLYIIDSYINYLWFTFAFVLIILSAQIFNTSYEHKKLSLTRITFEKIFTLHTFSLINHLGRISQNKM